MAIADYVANVVLNNSGALAGLKQTDDAAKKGLGATLEKINKKVAAIGATMTKAVTLPVIAGFGAVAAAAGDFEASIIDVEAQLKTNEQQTDSLARKARDLGAATKFSAAEAADAIVTLAKNGLNYEQIMDGAVDASLNLAAAMGADIASAADLATDAVANFGFKAEDLGEVADRVAGAAFSSKFGFDDMRLAIGQAAGVAGQVGVSFDDFVTSLAATSSAFSGGSDAGTSFKTFLTRLTPQSKEAAGLMEELGLKFFDASGNMLPMADIAGSLSDALGSLSEEQRTAAATTLFGADAMRTGLLLANAGKEGFEQYAESVKNVSAEQIAAAKQKGLNGLMLQLKSAVSELGLVIATSGVLEFAKDLVVSITGVVRWLAKANPALVKIGVAFAALAAFIGPLLLALPLMASGFALLFSPITAIIAAIGAAIFVVKDLWDLFTGGESIIGDLLKLIGIDMAASIDVMKAAFAEIPGFIKSVIDKVKQVWSSMTDWIENTTLFKLITGKIGIGSALSGVTDAIGGALSSIGGMFGGVSDTASTGPGNISNSSNTANVTNNITIQTSDPVAAAQRVGDQTSAALNFGLN